jgi:hypothetical protein
MARCMRECRPQYKYPQLHNSPRGTVHRLVFEAAVSVVGGLGRYMNYSRKVQRDGGATTKKLRAAEDLQRELLYMPCGSGVPPPNEVRD